MCGICGVVDWRGWRPAPEMEQSVRAMLDATSHRGPHGDACAVRENLAMAVNRLAIRGVDQPQPPLIEHDSGIIVACNGEIDNHRELRQMLAECGHAVTLDTDVAVIAPLYLEKGLSFLEHLQGVFALALWDERCRRLILARDRAGERHLYYSITDDRVVFASELAALVASRQVPVQLDARGVAQFLRSGYCASPRSPLRGMRKMGPGEMVVLEPEGIIKHQRYWTLPAHSTAPIQPPLRTFDGIFRAAVTRQSDVDVDYGVLLSGGVDSALIAAVARGVRPEKRLPAYCIRFAEASYDEGEPAARVARDLGCEFVPVAVSAVDVPETLRELVRSTGELLADPAWIPMSLVARRAARDVRMLLSGEGADELFGGYPTYLGAHWAGLYARLPRPVRTASRVLVDALPASDKKMPVRFLLKRFIRGQGMDDVARHLLWMSAITPEWLLRLGIKLPPDDRQTNAEPAIDAVQRYDFEHSLPDALMAKSDRGSMLHAVEIRAPFLDREVIEFATTLPLAARIRGLTTKPFLKRYALDYLPRAIVNRRKRGLSVPLSAWLRGPLQAWAQVRLGHTALADAGIDMVVVQQLFAEHLERRSDHARAIWTLIVLSEWLEWLCEIRTAPLIAEGGHLATVQQESPGPDFVSR
ncbi:MAG: asparagine synthase (glutamine-hydrolyzing) [Rhodanobacteraceae bacterium]